MQQTGKFIDEGGNNFWGVEVVTTAQGDRLFAGSDRDFGLYLFRYTGPGAYQKPQAAAAPPPAARTLGDPMLSGDSVRVNKKRYARVSLSCPETTGGDCRGLLSMERRNGWITLAQKWFAKDADAMSSVRLRIARPEFRRLLKQRRQRVTIELLTRGIDGELRHAEHRITLLAPRGNREGDVGA